MGCGCNKKKTSNVTPEQGNLGAVTKVGKVKKKKKKMPSLANQAWNLVKSTTDYVQSGMENVSADDYKVRLKVCGGCPFREKDRCTKCGCFIQVKAKWKTATCPDHRWPEKIKN